MSVVTMSWTFVGVGSLLLVDLDQYAWGVSPLIGLAAYECQCLFRAKELEDALGEEKEKAEE